MTTMLEKAAMALAAVDPMLGELPWKEIRDEWQETYLRQARAVLLAVREPGGDIWEAGNDALSLNGLDSVEGDDSIVCFTAMIDAILNEEQTDAA